jgi:hypothetical protein
LIPELIDTFASCQVCLNFDYFDALLVQLFCGCWQLSLEEQIAKS